MKEKEMLEQAMKLQDSLNSKIDKDWKKNRTERDFQIAIIQEISELIDSYPYKWWKKMKDNEFNKKVELVDIFHFLLSYSILKEEEYYNFDEMVDFYYKSYSVADKYDVEKDDYDVILSLLDGVISEKVISMICNFYELVKRHFTSLEEFLKWYFVKNVLNEIRQLKGYKEGNYQKVLDGMEDNEVIYKLADSIEFTDFDSFRENLINRYIYYTTARQDFV